MVKVSCLWCSRVVEGLQHSSADHGRSHDTGKGKSGHSNSSKKMMVEYGFSLVKGKSKHKMEDYHVAEFRLVKQKELGLFAIFDGHMGHTVSNYLQHHLFDTILKQPEFWSNPMKAIAEAYARTDQAIISKARELGSGGSTAVTAIVVDGKQLMVANVGDSRAVLCRNGLAHQLSVDHEPSMEQRSIEDMGGFVSNIPGDVPRVDGQLAVSRAFGDKSLKIHLRSDPDIQVRDIDEATKFLILASDGLWKVMENQVAVDLIKVVKDPQEAAKQLTNEALARNSKDDVSCIVVRFG